MHTAAIHTGITSASVNGFVSDGKFKLRFSALKNIEASLGEKNREREVILWNIDRDQMHPVRYYLSFFDHTQGSILSDRKNIYRTVYDILNVTENIEEFILHNKLFLNIFCTICFQQPFSIAHVDRI